jgi:hypothetical protein
VVCMGTIAGTPSHRRRAMTAELERIQEAMEFHDNDILNKLYGTSSIAVQHRKYDISTAELRSKSHEASTEAKYVHFSDWPITRPWLEAKKDGRCIS